MNIVIMAGGGGSRLWPLSRRRTPKQFLDLGTGKTLIEHVYARARQLTGPKHIYIATASHYQSQIKKLLPRFPQSQIFYEPEKRDTTAAFASVAVRLAELGEGQTPTIFMWSDHVFTNEALFLKDLKKIPQLLKQYPDSVVVLGHTPISPETGLGYIEVGQKVSGQKTVFRVKTFKEKPKRATAEKYLQAGGYYWNLGYFSLRPQYLLQELIRLNASLKKPINNFRKALESRRPKTIASAYHQFPAQAVEYTLIERTPRILAVTGDYGWSDVGNWSTVKEIFGKAGDHMPKGHHVHVDSTNNFVYNTTPKVVSLIGMNDTIVVVTEDAVLVTNQKQAHKVKDVVQRLEQAGKNNYV